MMPPSAARALLAALAGVAALGCGATPRVSTQATCRRAPVAADPGELERYYRAHGDPLVILGGEVFVCDCPRRHYGARQEQRVVAGVAEHRVLGGQDERRVLGGAQEDRRTEGVEERRLVAGADEARRAAGVQEERRVGVVEEARRVDAAEEVRRVDAVGEDRTVRGAQEARRSAGVQEERAHGGDVSPLSCAEEIGCSGWMINAAAAAIYDHRGLVPLRGRCVEL